MIPIIKKHSYAIFLYSSILLSVLFGVLLMLSPLGKVTADGGAVIKTLDSGYFYNSEHVISTLTAMGEAGRRAYTVFHILDYFFIISYCMLMVAATRPFVTDKTKAACIIFPILPSVCDFVENTLIEVASASFPNMTAALVKTIPVFTALKWCFVLVWLAVFGALVIRFVINKIREKSANSVNK